MSAGQCIKYADIPESTFESGVENADIMKYASHGVYDLRRQRVIFTGRRESADYPYHALTFEEGTDTFAIDDFELWTTDTYTSGHGYAHNAMDPLTGDYYYRVYGSDEVWKYDGSTWDQLPSLGTVGVNLEVAGALLYVPGHGLIYYDRRRMKLLAGGAGSWAQIHDFGAQANAYQAIAQYNPISKLIVLGGGNTDDLMFKIDVKDPSLTLVPIATPDWNWGTSESQSVVIPDAGGPNFLSWNKKTANWVEYDVSADEYNTLTQSSGGGSSPQAGTPNIDDSAGGHPTIGVPLWRYRTNMYIQSTGGGGTAWLYKHS